ncbi:E3 ubiquitin-protein ligase RHA2A [Dioscorea cayenensis subsp. rotundata]|uniref:E3 ubiquitin-protein ligase RHA2A n=1 Tax=Dioscorea cayennensis subsp. rotundata TaxID=55577 RepID=A0AB40B6M5_DIOCR|nr:E3 ubiquitin-protein ligase RHA2A [Dioscorea cayenensis subsp. rotundata]
MGLSNSLSDASGDSIPILLVVAAAGWVSYLRSLLLCLLHSLGLSRSAAAPILSAASGSGLASLIALADTLNAARPSAYDGPDEDCVVCLCGLARGDRVRRLSCCHVFHAECLDGWLDQMNLSCPLCRSPLAADSDAADRRIGAELVAWLSPSY